MTEQLNKKLEKVTRFEVIDDEGRAYVAYGVKVELLDFQDDGKTLKIFIKGKNSIKNDK
jgi:hypothetical protein